jgi:hypothetical protein
MIPENFTETKNTLLDQYQTIAIKDFLSKDVYTEIGYIQNMIIDDMELGFEDKPVEMPLQDEIDWICNNLYKLQMSIIISPINDIIISYVINLVGMINSWNINIKSDSQLSILLKAITDLLHTHVTLRDLLNMNKILMNEWKKFRDYKPVSYECAKHFHDKLEERIKEKVKED